MNLALRFLALAVSTASLACSGSTAAGGDGSTAGADGSTPAFPLDQPLTVEQSDCGGEAAGGATAVTRSADGILVSNYHTDCRTACAYFVEGESVDKILVQPCDLDDKDRACLCTLDLAIDLQSSGRDVVVYRYADGDEPVELGTVSP